MGAMRHRFGVGLTLIAGVLVAAAMTTSAVTAAATPSTVTTWVARPSCSRPAQGRMTCFAMHLVQKRVPAAMARGASTRRVTASLPKIAVGLGGGYTPGDLATAYGVNPNAATNQVVAIVDAYDDPNVRSELNAFNSHYGLPPETASSFRVVNQLGGTQLSATPDSGWAAEIALDAQAVRGLCHKCRIVVVEADDSDSTNLGTAVSTAATTIHANIITNSYGGSGIDPADQAKYDHPGVAILASTGDDGWYDYDQINPGDHSGRGPGAPEVPAALSTVIAVGGTSLYLNDDATRLREDVWNSNGPKDYYGFVAGLTGATGGGCSSDYAAPGWQKSVAGYSTLGCATGKRSATDIAAIGDPFTGFDIYRSYGVNTPGWSTYGGTSLASPVVAALWALAGGPGAVKYPALSLYGHFKSDTTRHLFDVAFGGNGLCDTAGTASCAGNWAGVTGNPNVDTGFGPVDCAWDFTTPGPVTPLINRSQCYAKAGYDGPSGVGAPIGLNAFTPLFPTVVIKPPATMTHNVSATFSGAGSSDPFPGGVLTPGATNVQYRWNWGDGHVDTITNSTSATHRYTAPGRKTITLSITDNYGQVGRKQLVVTIH